MVLNCKGWYCAGNHSHHIGILWLYFVCQFEIAAVVNNMKIMQFRWHHCKTNATVLVTQCTQQNILKM